MPKKRHLPRKQPSASIASTSSAVLSSSDPACFAIVDADEERKRAFAGFGETDEIDQKRINPEFWYHLYTTYHLWPMLLVPPTVRVDEANAEVLANMAVEQGASGQSTDAIEPPAEEPVVEEQPQVLESWGSWMWRKRYSIGISVTAVLGAAMAMYVSASDDKTSETKNANLPANTLGNMMFGLFNMLPFLGAGLKITQQQNQIQVVETQSSPISSADTDLTHTVVPIDFSQEIAAQENTSVPSTSIDIPKTKPLDVPKNIAPRQSTLFENVAEEIPSALTYLNAKQKIFSMLDEKITKEKTHDYLLEEPDIVAMRRLKDETSRHFVHAIATIRLKNKTIYHFIDAIATMRPEERDLVIKLLDVISKIDVLAHKSSQHTVFEVNLDAMTLTLPLETINLDRHLVGRIMLIYAIRNFESKYHDRIEEFLQAKELDIGLEEPASKRALNGGNLVQRVLMKMNLKNLLEEFLFFSTEEDEPDYKEWRSDFEDFLDFLLALSAQENELPQAPRLGRW